MSQPPLPGKKSEERRFRRDDVSPPIFFRGDSAVTQARQCKRDRWKDLKRLKYHIVRASLQYKRLSRSFEMTRGLPGPGLIPLAPQNSEKNSSASKEPPFPLHDRLADEALVV